MNLNDTVREQLNSNVPFAQYLGVVVTSLGTEGAVAALEQRHDCSNHIGSHHAGALFTLGETASGAAMAGIFADILSTVTPVAAEAQITYRRLARGRITATAVAAEPAAELRARLSDNGRVQFAVQVTLADQKGTEVAAMIVEWNLRQRATQ